LTYLSPAKINLFLHVTSKRADGYHNLQTIFQLLDYYDEISLDYREDGAINRISGNEGIPQDQDLVVRSATILKKISGSKGGVDIMQQLF
jgi:4-diphosphocytidyl-2-C-methyl-D-erythritol kinase